MASARGIASSSYPRVGRHLFRDCDSLLSPLSVLRMIAIGSQMGAVSAAHLSMKNAK